ncbi:MAG: tRNA preQ1(34) S-adenosylmethionine ribosyltransferase-isomerase QueA [Verrucomicrobia bacterium]|nr:MAG: tRNA preQ1(34) S-adenosylmethionine ribosyltransferase-isomerase QueA [Verrucomicrobiota bacterium]
MTYNYELPESLIADRPPPKRGSSRMLVLERSTGRITHTTFNDFPNFIQPGDLVVLNDSRVSPARIFSADKRVELLVLEQMPGFRWKCFVKPGRRVRLGTAIRLANTTARVIEILKEGERVFQLDAPVDLNVHGVLPLPPYIKRPVEPVDRERYQTVFARTPGSIAAPTAGLHFDSAILSQIPHAFLTLHVGVGTFRPIKCERIEDHVMHEENYFLPPRTADALNKCQRVIAVGTTVTRVLESQPPKPFRSTSGSTRLFIRPPYQFQQVNQLLTNFHLPKSTLLMLVCAFAGTEVVLAAYREAIEKKYRFFSYGDCMLII